MKDNLTETCNILLNLMIERGELKVLLTYNNTDESLNLIPPQAKNSGLNLIFINSRFSDFHMGKNCSI